MLKILHLSDIHFGQEKKGELVWHNDVRDQLIADLTRLLNDSSPLDLILVNGDVAYSGKKTEYDTAVGWLERIIDVGRCDESAVFTIPGNHDVDIDLISKSARLVHTQFRMASPETVNPLLHEYANEAPEVNALFPKLQAYGDFARGYDSDFDNAEVPRWIRTVPLGHGSELRMIGMCSVQICDLEDRKGTMVLGDKQYIFPDNRNVVTLVMIHHPMPWLLDKDNASRYLNARSSILLTGHEHLPELKKIIHLDGFERFEISAGAITSTKSDGPFEFAYNLLELELDGDAHHSLNITVWPRVWNYHRVVFEADKSKTGGPESKTVSIDPRIEIDAIRQLTEHSPQPIVVGAEMPRDDDAEFGQLKHFFWHYLSWEQRISVLVKAGIWPLSSSGRLPQTIELEALRSARTAGKLASIWDETMSFVPISKQKPNPFRREKQ